MPVVVGRRRRRARRQLGCLLAPAALAERRDATPKEGEYDETADGRDHGNDNVAMLLKEIPKVLGQRRAPANAIPTFPAIGARRAVQEELVGRLAALIGPEQRGRPAEEGALGAAGGRLVVCVERADGRLALLVPRRALARGAAQVVVAVAA